MSELVANCPRCKAKEMTFDLVCEIQTCVVGNWQRNFEAFCICRSCKMSTVFVLAQSRADTENYFRANKLRDYNGAVNQIAIIKGHISLKDQLAITPPDYLTDKIKEIFNEGAACMAIGCHNAGATMFRLCIDLATKSMLPEEDIDGLNNKIRRNLGLRLPWLFKNSILPAALEELSSCIKEDGNDGAHEGTLNENDAENILDFTYVLLERLYTEPQRLKLAKERREARREK